MTGCLAGLAMTLWVTVGAYITKPFSPPLPPGPVDGCSGVDNSSVTLPTTEMDLLYSSSTQVYSSNVTYTTVDTEIQNL